MHEGLHANSESGLRLLTHLGLDPEMFAFAVRFSTEGFGSSKMAMGLELPEIQGVMLF